MAITPQTTLHCHTKEMNFGRGKSNGQETKRVSRNSNVLALQHYVARDFSAGTKRLLGLSIQLGLHAAGIAEGKHELILSFPFRFFTRTQQRLLRTSAIDLNDDPAEFGSFQVEDQRFLRIRRCLQRKSSERPFRTQGWRNRNSGLWHGSLDRSRLPH